MMSWFGLIFHILINIVLKLNRNKLVFYKDTALPTKVKNLGVMDEFFHIMKTLFQNILQKNKCGMIALMIIFP